MSSDERFQPGTRGYRRVTWALFAAGLATFAELYTTQPLLPLLSAHFGVTAGSAALSVSVTTLTLGIALLFVGPMSEVIGRTKVMMISLFGASVMTVAYLREEVVPSAMARATGQYIGGTALGGMSGRLVAGALADVGGWRHAVAGIGVLGLVCAIFVRATLPPSRHFVAVPLDHRVLWTMTRRVLSDRVLLTLYVLPFLSMGAFVAVYNAMGFRPAAAPYQLSAGAAGLVFLIYLLGSVSSSRAGRFADRYGHRAVVPLTLVLMLAGLLISLARPLALVIVGLALFTMGFFGCHGVATGWVVTRAAASGPGAGQASALYTFMYYLGSSVAGFIAGIAWSTGGWSRVVEFTGALVALGFVISMWLRRTSPL
ncbi:MFS transporter, partial [Cutibacterium granulosum]|uniref:MFS transporter n=1 Tax=Cutibacterium granulosum TaxID=33011 RepID=UPI002B23C1F1